MLITLDLPPDAMNELRKEAQYWGITPEEFIIDLIIYESFLDHRNGIEETPSFNQKIAVIHRKRRGKVAFVSFREPSSPENTIHS